MNAIIACNLILDSCGILILLLLLIPAYIKKNDLELLWDAGTVLLSQNWDKRTVPVSQYFLSEFIRCRI